MKNLVVLPLLAVLFFSCKTSPEKLITGKWQAVKLENPTLEQQITQLKSFLDTVGQHTTIEQNEVLYGVKNIDSLKQIQEAQIEQALQQQANDMQHTFFNFLQDGKVIYSFGTNPDTACWYIEGEKKLVLDEKKLKGMGSVVKMDILLLEKEHLQLGFHENSFSSTATFSKAANE